MKTFSLLNIGDDTIKEFHSKTAREAALKAASREESLIILIEEQGFHVFKGSKKLLDESKQNDFTKSKNIHYKPQVTKMGYKRFDTTLDVKKKTDLKSIKDEIETFMNVL